MNQNGGEFVEQRARRFFVQPRRHVQLERKRHPKKFHRGINKNPNSSQLIVKEVVRIIEFHALPSRRVIVKSLEQHIEERGDLLDFEALLSIN